MRTLVVTAATAAAVVAAGGCRQILGIPGDVAIPGVRVGGTITGAVGAAAANVYLAIDGVQVDQIAVTADGELDLFAEQPGGTYEVTADATCTVSRGTGTLTDAGVDDVAVTCDGLSSLRTLGLSAPVGLTQGFAPDVEGYTLAFSMLTQELTLRPAPNYPDTSIAQVSFGASVIDPSGDHYGPIALADGSDLELEVHHGGVANHDYVAGARATPPAEFGYGKASDSAAAAWFGAAVAADTDLVVVGAPEHSGQTGEAFVYRRTDQQWTEDAVLVASDATTGARFGQAVAVSGDTIAIGAPGAGGGGAVYIYQRDGADWIEQRLTASDGAPDDRFGAAVAIAGNVAVIGAPGADAGGTDAGAAYVFTRATTWNEHPALHSPSPEPGAGFGTSVATSTTVAIVGAPDEDAASLVDSGAVYAFSAPWSAATATAIAPDTGSAGDHFGAAVAIAADGTIAVGAPQGDAAGLATGQAYVFAASTHLQTDAIVPDAGTAGDGFGATIAIAGRVVAIGAPQEDSGVPGTPDETASAAGAVLIYPLGVDDTAGTGVYLKASNIGAGDQFGAALALTVDQLVVGAPFEDSGTDGWSTSSNTATNNADEAGAVYAFR